jgi:hypothetical protein
VGNGKAGNLLGVSMAAKNYAAFSMLLPALIQFAEDIHGPTNGRKKLSTVTALAQNAILVSSAAGFLDPDLAMNTVAITDAVEKTLALMKANKELKRATEGQEKLELKVESK